MKQPCQPGPFDVEECVAQLTEMGDPLVGMKTKSISKSSRLGTPEAKAKRRQKDTNAGQQHKLIQSYALTSVSVHDSQVFDELLDPSEDTAGNKRTVYADSAYRSEAQEHRLAMPRRRAKSVRRVVA